MMIEATDPPATPTARPLPLRPRRGVPPHGTHEGDDVERPAGSLAVAALSLSEAVAEPRAMIIDDAHWLDRSPDPNVHVGAIGGPRLLSRCNVAGRLLAAWDR